MKFINNGSDDKQINEYVNYCMSDEAWERELEEMADPMFKLIPKEKTGD